MDVIIDARMVNEHLHGIARYTYEIIKNISSNDDIKFKVLINDLQMAKKIFGGFKNIEFITMKSKFLSFGEQVEIPHIINKYKNEVIFHSPSFVCSPFAKCNMVMTIHDLNHIKLPQYYSPFHKYYYKYIVKPSALKCKKIFTVSNFSKSEIVKWLNCDERKVVVTYNGVDSKYKKINDKIKLNEIKRKYNLPDNFILYIGNLKQHKNVEMLIKAIKKVKYDMKLVINGKPNESILKIINELKVKNRIEFIGYIDENDLPYIYNLARIFAFISLYEGFGLPVLEARACGCPVIVSNSSSLPEVAGNSSVLVDPNNELKIVNAINDYLSKPIDAEMIKRDSEEAKKFRWEITSAKTLEVYRSIGK